MTADPRDQQEPSMEEILSSIRRIIADEEAEGGSSGEDEDELEAQAADETGEVELAEPEDAEEDVLELTKVVRESGEVVDLRASDGGADPAEPEHAEEAEAPIAEADEAPITEAEESPGPDDGEEDPFAEDDEDPFAEDEQAIAAAAAPDGAEDELAFAPAGAHAEDVTGQDPSQEDDVTVPKQVAREELLSDAAASAATGAFAKLSHAFQRTPIEESIADGDGRTLEQFVEDMIRPMLREWLDENMPPIVERLVEKELHKIARRAELM